MHWYAVQDSVDAVAALQFYRRMEDVSIDMEEMDTESGNMDGSDEREQFTVKKLFTDRNLLMPLLIACALQVVQQLSGINAVCHLPCYFIHL